MLRAALVLESWKETNMSAILIVSTFYTLRRGWGKEDTKKLTLQKDLSVLNDWKRKRRWNSASPGVEW